MNGQVRPKIMAVSALAIALVIGAVADAGGKKSGAGTALENKTSKSADKTMAKKVSIGGGLTLGEAKQIENLTVWPVYSDRKAEPLNADFVSLETAQQKGLVVIREVGKPTPRQGHREVRTASGSIRNVSQTIGGEVDGVVGELVVENRGKQPILVLAGTLLKGGKQDRQVGQDFVVPPEKTVPVTAFCVEHGRWTATREGKTTAGQFEAKAALATRDVRRSGQYDGDQSAVWANVAEENKRAGKAPSSGTLMATVENGDKASQERRASVFDALTAHFNHLADTASPPVGIAYAVDGELREIRTFTHPKLLTHFSKTLFTTIAMETDLALQAAVSQKRPIHRKAAPVDQVRSLVAEVEKADARDVRSEAGNINRMRRSKKAVGNDCYTDKEADLPVTRSFMKAR